MTDAIVHRLLRLMDSASPGALRETTKALFVLETAVEFLSGLAVNENGISDADIHYAVDKAEDLWDYWFEQWGYRCEPSPEHSEEEAE